MPAYAFDFEMAQNSNHFCLELNFSSNFEPSQFFRAKKVSHFGQKTRDQYFEQEIREKMNGSNFEPSQNQMHMLARDFVSIDDFLSHLTIPPVLYCSSIGDFVK